MAKFRDLPDILRPFDVAVFLQEKWGKQYCLVRGLPTKFSGLLTWTDLNAILEQHRLDWPRIRLIRDGRQLPSTQYLRIERNRRGVQVPHLKMVALNQELREGAVLVIDVVDEICDAVRELAWILEQTFRERVQVNAYIGWNSSQGFDLHWDDHDVFIIQVNGKKSWAISEPTRPYPLHRDMEETTILPERMVWEGTLNEGDLLYLPRGWWHKATALDEPTIHLTCAVTNRTGIDLLEWFTDEMRSREIFRMDLPRFFSREEALLHLQRLCDEFLKEWDESLLQRFFRAWDAKAEPRPQSSLPWSAMPEVLPPDDSFLLRMVPSRPVVYIPAGEGNTVVLLGNNKEWRFMRTTEAIIKLLVEGRPVAVSDLIAAVDTKLDRSAVRTFLSELVLQGLLVIVRAPDR